MLTSAIVKSLVLDKNKAEESTKETLTKETPKEKEKETPKEKEKEPAKPKETPKADSSKKIDISQKVAEKVNGKL